MLLSDKWSLYRDVLQQATSESFTSLVLFALKSTELTQYASLVGFVVYSNG